MILLSLFDKKASYYHPPLAYEHVSQALRSYAAFARKQPESLQVQFSEDYDIYQVGTFESVSGSIESHPPQFVECLANIVKESLKGPFGSDNGVPRG